MENNFSKVGNMGKAFNDGVETTMKQPQLYVGMAVGVIVNVIINRGITTQLASRMAFGWACGLLTGGIMEVIEQA